MFGEPASVSVVWIIENQSPFAPVSNNLQYDVTLINYQDVLIPIVTHFMQVKGMNPKF